MFPYSLSSLFYANLLHKARHYLALLSFFNPRSLTLAV